MSSAHEANTQRLMAALRDKETALKVSPSRNGSVSILLNNSVPIWSNCKPALAAYES